MDALSGVRLARGMGVGPVLAMVACGSGGRPDDTRLHPAPVIEEAPVPLLTDDTPRGVRAALARKRLETSASLRATPQPAPTSVPADTKAPRELGIDVSHYQGDISWPDLVAGGVVFVYMKASEGSYQDPMFITNWKQAAMQRNDALAEGRIPLFRGAYHFFRPLDDPIAQAEFFIKTVGQLEPGDLPPTLDVEWDYADKAQTQDRWASISAEEGIQRIQKWTQRVGEALGRTPVIYTNAYFWNERFSSYEQVLGSPLWISDWTAGSAASGQPFLPTASTGWTFWQYRSTGSVQGIRGDVDQNRFDGGWGALNALAGLQ